MTHDKRNQHDAMNRADAARQTDGDTAMNEQEQLTAYALGELAGDDAQRIEALLERDADARAQVEAIRAMAGELATALADEPAPQLTEAQRAAIEAGPANGAGGAAGASDDDAPPVVYSYKIARWAGVGLLAAAAVGLAFVWPMMTDRVDGPTPNEVAIGEADDGTALGLGERAAVDRRAGTADDANWKQLDGRGSMLLRDETGKIRGVSPELDTSIAQMREDMKSHAPGASDEQIEDDLQTLLTTGSSVTLEPPQRRLNSTTAAAPPPAPAAEAMPRARRVAPESDVNYPYQRGQAGGGGSIFGDPGADPERVRTSTLSKQAEVRAQLDRVLREAQGRELTDKESEQVQKLIRDAGIKVLTDPRDSPHSRTDWSREAYARLTDNQFNRTVPNPTGDDNLSTFSIDVDTASYANVRRMINSGQLPPAGAVRIEEMINYFDYGYETPSETAEHPFNVDVQVTSAPWQPEHRLVRIGLKGYEVPMDNRPATNLVFLLDTSGSMNRPNKLPLVQQSINMLVDALHGDDRVAIVTYAGSSGVALNSTYVEDKASIKSAVNALTPGGSTHGSAGIQLAYDIAQQHYIEGGINRVVLCTDGDFNVGVTSDDQLVKLIETKRETGVFLSVLGFGTGNWQDEKMEQLSNHGNGVAAYIDTEREAKKVLVEQAAGTLMTIAKDVKIQVDFNPNKVAAYRLIGYANRMLEAQDFSDDTKDAGEIGAGHTVTALYEVVPVGVAIDIPSVEPSKYAQAPAAEDAAGSGAAGEAEAQRDAAKGEAGDEDVQLGSTLHAADDERVIRSGQRVEALDPMMDELLTVRVRYKQPDADESVRFDTPVVDDGSGIDAADGDVQFAAAVAAFGMLLRESPYKGDASWAMILDLAEAGRGEDAHGYRAEFIELVRMAQRLAEPTAGP